MKIKPYRFQVRRAGGEIARATPSLNPQPKTLNTQRGIALVITLVLLSVITFMAVTFLVVSRHEGAQVDTITQQSNAKFAADAAAQQAMAQVIAQMQANNNGLNFGLMVSANYVGPSYDPNTAAPHDPRSITNVGYFDLSSNSTNFSSAANYEQMLNNLLILPRPPVFIPNKKTGTSDFRFWLDLNRNGIFDTNGYVLVVDQNGNLTTNVELQVGDPEWVGVLNHPEQRHSPSNYFVARYAFIALPIGNSLDINYIHNQAVQIQGMTVGQETGGYLRNQGVGSWELNLAGFLNTLSPNFWPIVQHYDPLAGFTPTGGAYDDAAAIVQYRYGKKYNNLATVPSLYGNVGSKAFANDMIDGYTTGPLMTNTAPLTLDGDAKAMTKYSPPFGWSGAENPTHFFRLGEFFDSLPLRVRSGAGITNAFYSAGTNKYTEDRYSFYRMLAQLSFGSQSSDFTNQYAIIPALATNHNYMSAYSNSPRMNLNYVNVNGTNATSFIPWTPTQFFTNAADRMLRAYFPNPISQVVNGITNTFFISITNIPIYPNNFYTPAVHRILQLAANMFDSVNTNQGDTLTPNGPYFPSVFRPVFSRPNKLPYVYISGYSNVVDTNDIAVFKVPSDLRRVNDINNFPVGFNKSVNVYGIPYIIGARAGWPSFNKFSSIPIVQMFRALELVSRDGHGYPSSKWGFNVRYEVSISNQIAMECWYPSTTNVFPRALDVYIGDESDMWLTNNTGMAPVNVPTSPVLTVTNYTPGTSTQWPGSQNLGGGVNANPLSFKLVLSNVLAVVSNAYLQASPPKLIAVSNFYSLPFQFTTNYFNPQWGLMITNRLRFIMVDHASKRVVDFVDLGGLGQTPGPDVYVDINSNLWALDQGLPSSYHFWDNTSSNSVGIPSGFNLQVAASMAYQYPPPPNNVWKSLKFGQSQSQVQLAQSNFNNFMLKPTNGASAQAPLVAYKAFVVLNNTWAANDPLVHYLTADLRSGTYTPKAYEAYTVTNPITDGQGIPIGQVSSKRYQPWNVPNNDASLSDVKANPIAYKDPLIYNFDQWQFPTNKFPNVGWLGRVHRGTPWQTVYLKSLGVDTKSWTNWTGNNLFTNYYGNNDQLIMQPNQDWLLMDLFTTAPNDNAEKGQLSINQTNAAAWAAVFDGLITLTNTPTGISPLVIDPVTNYQAFQALTTNINIIRTNFPGASFGSVGQICSVPQLTINSPFINPTNGFPGDAVVERIPQQIMGLLKVGTPRYVIFAYGQSLKPADRSIVTSGPFFGMCTNYQITGETVTRTVVRFDNYPVPGQPNTAKPRAVVESFNVLPPE